MNDVTLKWIKGVAGLAVLAIVFFTVMSFIGNAREDMAGRRAAETETSPTPAANGDAAEQPAQEAEKPAAEGGGEQTAPKKVVIVVIDGLNFRKEPNGDSAAIRGLAEGDRLTYLGSKDGWYHVQDVEGVKGYVSANKQYTRLEDR